MLHLRPVQTLRRSALILVCSAAVLAGRSAFAAPNLLYNWNFDSDSDNTLAANSAANLNATGGTLTMRNSAGAATNFHGSAGSGHTGAVGDLAFDTSSGSLASASPVGLSPTGDITTVSQNKITITGWLKDTGESNYSDTNFSRILTLGPTGYDGAAGSGIANPAPNSSLSLGVYNFGNTFGALQLKVNGAGGANGFDGLISANQILPSTGNQWFFFAITYDSTAAIVNNQGVYSNSSQPTVNMYIGNAQQSLSTPAFSAAYVGVTGQNPSSPGPIQFTGAIASLMNRTANSRNLPYVGFGDDFRIYDSVLTTAELNQVRQNLPFRTPGDFNLDGVVNAADLPVMLGALTDLNAYQTNRNLNAADLQTIGDLNGDTLVTNIDIQALNNLIAGNLPPAMRGDMNRDGHISPADLPLLLQALTDLDKYRTDHSLSVMDFTTMGDANLDLVIDHDDIQALQDLINSMGGGAVAVPEPSIFALFFGAFFTFLGFRYAPKTNFFRFSFLNRAKYLHRL